MPKIIKALKLITPKTTDVTIGDFLRDRVARINCVMIQLRITGKLGKIQSFDDNHAPIWEYLKTHKCKNIMEIGLGYGENAKKILSIAKDCEFYCFDILGGYEALDNQRIRDAYLELSKRKNVHFYIGDTKLTLPLVVDELPMMDVIFIDGGHDRLTVKNDLEFCKRLMGENSICFVHDSEGYGPWLAVGRIGDEFSVNYIADSLPIMTVVKKRREFKDV